MGWAAGRSKRTGRELRSLPPLKTAAAAFLALHGTVGVRIVRVYTLGLSARACIFCRQRVLTNKKEQEDLEAKLKAILSIVENYRASGRVDIPEERASSFST